MNLPVELPVDSLSDSSDESDSETEQDRPKKQNKILVVIDESLAAKDEMNKYLFNDPGVKKVHFGNIDKESVDTYDVIFSGMLNHYVPCNMDVLSVYSDLLVPGGHLIVKTEPNSLEELYKTIKICGFLHVVMNVSTNMIVANTPPFKFGFSDKVTLNSETKENEISASKLDDNNPETISEDDLLAADDLKKLDSSVLKVCVSTKKAKACKGCSCELAEELETACKLKDTPKPDTFNENCSCECVSSVLKL